jgi:Protein of unknown function (DUF1593)
MIMRNFTVYLTLFTCLALPFSVATAQSKLSKTRTIITTDGEIDDVDSFIRMLLYANEFSIEGLVYSSSSPNAFFKMPSDIKKDETIHLILEVTDSGKFKMTRYQRVIVKGG